MTGLQSVPRESNDKDMAVMLDELTIEANEESFVIVLQRAAMTSHAKDLELYTSSSMY